jgi:hypothetical protein
VKYCAGALAGTSPVELTILVVEDSDCSPPVAVSETRGL